VAEWGKQATKLQKRVNKLNALLDTLDKEEPSSEGEIKAEYKKLEGVRIQLDDLKTKLDELQGNLETAEMLEEILGNGGLKSYIFDNITPELNRTIDKYIKILDDIDIEVSTVTKLKSGDFREKFSIKVENPYGAGQYKGNSGGEQQKVNLAVALGFNRVLRDMAEAAVNVVFLDEPFESLDEGSSEKVIELCETFSDMGNVFLITHQQSVKDLVSNVLTVEKKDGLATILDA
jgi:DNA repair exonuclease SbcCD ATPase subunit